MVYGGLLLSLPHQIWFTLYEKILQNKSLHENDNLFLTNYE